MKTNTSRQILQNVAALAMAAIVSSQATAQTSSLYGVPRDRAPLSLTSCSWTYQPQDEPKTVKIHDLITIVVDQKSAMISDGKIDRKKQGYGDLKLEDWIKFYSGSLGRDNQVHGEPHVRGTVDNKLRAEGNLETTDSLKFRIACSVVDIRPNGNIVLEGHSTVKNNEEVWDYALTGETRPDSILPNNTVLSENIADMKIVKRETGHVRDSYRRGWALEWLDKWQPF